MYQYCIVECWADGIRCVLRCNRGRYHAARTLNAVPPVDLPLRGDRPHLGFGILVCVRTGAIFRMIFESINEAQLELIPGRTHHLASDSAPASDTSFAGAERYVGDRRGSVPL